MKIVEVVWLDSQARGEGTSIPHLITARQQLPVAGRGTVYAVRLLKEKNEPSRN